MGFEDELNESGIKRVSVVRLRDRTEWFAGGLGKGDSGKEKIEIVMTCTDVYALFVRQGQRRKRYIRPAAYDKHLTSINILSINIHHFFLTMTLHDPNTDVHCNTTIISHNVSGQVLLTTTKNIKS